MSNQHPSFNNLPIPVVCIGLSAGGTTPVTEIFKNVSTETGMAFVVIHHLRRALPTRLDSILSHCTRMPVQFAEDGLLIQPNHVYILPSGEEITLNDGTFAVNPRSKLTGWPNLVSVFIDSMIRSRHPGIAVILSGMDADGAESLVRLKKHGGIVIAQSPESASTPDMPRAAIRTGAVDQILDPPAIGAALTGLAENVVIPEPV